MMESWHDNATVLNGVGDARNSSDFNYENSTISVLAKGDVFRETSITKTVIIFAIFPILAFIGIFGNISTIIIFFLKKQKTASIIFIIGLAMSDLLFLFFRLIENVYSIGHLYFTEAIRYVRPNSFVWINLSHIPRRTGYLFVLAIVMERFTAVWFPLHLKQIWTTTRSRMVSVAIVLLTLCDLVTTIDVIIFCMNERIPEQGRVSTILEVNRYLASQSKFNDIWTISCRVALEIVPYALVFIFNVLIIIGIRVSSSSLDLNSKLQQRKQKEARTTRMLLTISVLFVVLSGPFTISMNIKIMDKIDNVTVRIILSGIMQILNVVNSVINFMVYGLNDSILRREYLKLWKCKKEVMVPTINRN